MSDGIPLTDADRWDWLETLREEALCSLTSGNPYAILSCSALKKKYRDVIRTAAYYWPNVRVHFVYLHVDTDIMRRRLMARHDHFMGPGMIESQFEALEVPRVDERDVCSIDASTSIEDVVAVVRRAVKDASVGCNSVSLTNSEIFGL
jgi:gluconokinase